MKTKEEYELDLINLGIKSYFAFSPKERAETNELYKQTIDNLNKYYPVEKKLP